MAQYHFRTTNIKMNWWQFSLSVSKETHLRLEGWDVTKEPSRALLHNFQWLLLVEIFQIHLNFLIDTLLYSLHSLWLFYWLWMVPLGLQTVETVQIDLAGTLVASLWSVVTPPAIFPYALQCCYYNFLHTHTLFCTLLHVFFPICAHFMPEKSTHNAVLLFWYTHRKGESNCSFEMVVTGQPLSVSNYKPDT